MAIESMIAYYCGDHTWSNLVKFYEPEWHKRENKIYFISIIEDEEISIVASAIMGNEALRWFDACVPSLDNRTPRDVIAMRPDGIKAVREILMRLP